MKRCRDALEAGEQDRECINECGETHRGESGDNENRRWDGEKKRNPNKVGKPSADGRGVRVVSSNRGSLLFSRGGVGAWIFHRNFRSSISGENPLRTENGVQRTRGLCA